MTLFLHPDVGFHAILNNDNKLAKSASQINNKTWMKEMVENKGEQNFNIAERSEELHP